MFWCKKKIDVCPKTCSNYLPIKNFTVDTGQVRLCLLHSYHHLESETSTETLVKPRTYSHLAARLLWDVMAINSIWASLIHIFPSSPPVLNHHFTRCQNGLWWPKTTRVTMCCLITGEILCTHTHTQETQIIKQVVDLYHTLLEPCYCHLQGGRGRVKQMRWTMTDKYFKAQRIITDRNLLYRPFTRMSFCITPAWIQYCKETEG